jgi:hypothetical protein
LKMRGAHKQKVGGRERGSTKPTTDFELRILEPGFGIV